MDYYYKFICHDCKQEVYSVNRADHSCPKCGSKRYAFIMLNGEIDDIFDFYTSPDLEKVC